MKLDFERLQLRARARRALQGAMAGFAATLPMTGVMFGAQKLGLLGEMPPRKITKRLLHALGMRPARETTDVATAVNHLGFGAGAGALYGAVMPPAKLPVGIAAGVGYGLGVWFASYQGWVPRAGVMPRASRDYRFGRQATMAIAHVVFGGVLGALTARRAA